MHFEAEVEATLVRQPEELHKRMRYLFELAEHALAEQLTPATTGIEPQHSNGQLARRPTTARQLALIQRLAAQGDMSLEALLMDVFDTDACEHLSVSEASRLIDILQAQAECGSEHAAHNGQA